MGISPFFKRFWTLDVSFGLKNALRKGSFFMNGRRNLRMLTRAAVLAAISLILFMPAFELALPFFPPWLKLDISAVPVLLAGFAMGPVGGLAVQAVKSLLHLFWSSTGGVGELADFLMGVSLMLPAALLYRYRKNFRTALIGLLAGIVCATVVGLLSNYYIMLPLYTQSMSMEEVIGAAASSNAAITDVKGYLVYGVLPFNLLKGVVVSLITLLLYKRVSPILHEKNERQDKQTPAS